MEYEDLLLIGRVSYVVGRNGDEPGRVEPKIWKRNDESSKTEGKCVMCRTRIRVWRSRQNGGGNEEERESKNGENDLIISHICYRNN